MHQQSSGNSGMQKLGIQESAKGTQYGVSTNGFYLEKILRRPVNSIFWGHFLGPKQPIPAAAKKTVTALLRTHLAFQQRLTECACWCS